MQHDAEQRPRLRPVPRETPPRDPRVAGRRMNQVGENPNQRCFAGAVRPEERHECARRNGKTHVAERVELAVAFIQLLNVNERWLHKLLISLSWR